MFCSLLLLFAAAPAFATKPFATKRKHPSAAEPSLSGASGHPLCTSGEKCIGSSDDGTVRLVLNGKPEDTYCENCWDSFRQLYPESHILNTLLAPESPGKGAESSSCGASSSSSLDELDPGPTPPGDDGPSLSGASGHPLCTSGEDCFGSSDDRTVRHLLNGKPADTYCEKCWDILKQRFEIEGESPVSPESPGEGTEEKDCDKDDFSVLVENLAEPEPLLAPPAPPLWRAALAASTWVDSEDEDTAVEDADSAAVTDSAAAAVASEDEDTAGEDADISSSSNSPQQQLSAARDADISSSSNSPQQQLSAARDAGTAAAVAALDESMKLEERYLGERADIVPQDPPGFPPPLHLRVPHDPGVPPPPHLRLLRHAPHILRNQLAYQRRHHAPPLPIAPSVLPRGSIATATVVLPPRNKYGLLPRTTRPPSTATSSQDPMTTPDNNTNFNPLKFASSKSGVGVVWTPHMCVGAPRKAPPDHLPFNLMTASTRHGSKVPPWRKHVKKTVDKTPPKKNALPMSVRPHQKSGRPYGN